MQVYLDNAATTPLAPEVFEAMKPFMLKDYGNPSSIHSHGRKVRAAIESARKSMATLLDTSVGELFFTSGGTEANNTLIRCSVDAYEPECAITSEAEHHAVLHTLQYLESKGKIKLRFVDLDEKGNVDFSHLESLLKTNKRSLVSLMHANNEIGNILDIERAAELAREYDAIFHSDTVQTIGHYEHDLQSLSINSITGSAHKFHGPKGIGFMYLKKGTKIAPLIHGGAQERNMRGGTENVCGIIGMAKALEIACKDREKHQVYIQSIKDRMIQKLQDHIEGVTFNGESASTEKSLYTVLNVSFPPSPENDMLLFTLDIDGISASAGSACSSGAAQRSHVLKAIRADPSRAAVRFSFGKYNTAEDIDYTVRRLAAFYDKTI